MRPGAEVIYFNLTPHMYWMIEKTIGVRFGDPEIEDGAYAWQKGGTQSFSAVLDSGTSLMMVPQEIFDNFMYRLFQHSATSVRYRVYNDMYITNCNENLFPNVYLLLEEYWVEMVPHDYLIRANKDPSIDQCYIGFIKSPIDGFILGDSFMRGYYVIHSDENNLVGIVPHANSSKAAPEFATVIPTHYLDATKFHNLTQRQIVELGIGIFATIVLLGLLIRCIWRKCHDTDDDEQSQGNQSLRSITTKLLGKSVKDSGLFIFILDEKDKDQLK